MKTILMQLIQSDTTYNKSITRYLYRTHPDLWKQICEDTNFLPEDALAKQRCWHILNDIYYSPLCPVTGDLLKWREKKYAPFSSMEAKNTAIGEILSVAIKGANHWRNKNPQKSVDANQKFTRRFKSGEHKPWHLRDRDPIKIAEKTKETCLKKYGVANGSQTLNGRKKNSESQIANGATPVHLRDLRRIYYEKVAYFTKQSWIRYFDQINPDRISRSENALDHIYSKHQGFKDGIPPYILGHWTNLRIITVSENSKKREKCGKTQDQLFEDYFRNK